jgi:hypothetical protein
MGKFKYSHADVAEAQKQHRKGYEGQPLDVVHSINLFMIRWPIKCKPSPAKNQDIVPTKKSMTPMVNWFEYAPHKGPSTPSTMQPVEMRS